MALKRKKPEKAVSFADSKNETFFYTQETTSRDLDGVRASHTRTALEKIIFKHPKSQLQHVRNLISFWRTQNISIVFGNLGRQPFLLNYYLDLCFSFEETVKVQCKWNLSLEYQRNQHTNVDFLFIVEPYFGFTVIKDPCVKHLIILTSHMNLCYWGKEEIDYYYLHLSTINTSRQPDPHLKHYKVLKPPIFHKQVQQDFLPQPVLLDVSNCKTAHEAYLRLLTGREMIHNNPFNLHLNPRDESILKINLHYHRKRIQELWASGRWKIQQEKNPFNEDSGMMDSFLYNFLNNPGTNSRRHRNGDGENSFSFP